MIWRIPAKTFLVGEYAALAGASAIVLTTNPCFELRLTKEASLQGIHPNSPAGKWWMQQGLSKQGLLWWDPYQGKGGLGASSGQFVAVYRAHCQLSGRLLVNQHLLDDYYHVAWQGEGLKPSGYDVLAQSNSGCVYINRQQERLECFDWVFSDLAFILIHSGKKLATHHHLQQTKLPQAIEFLSATVELARNAFQYADSDCLVKAVNRYQKQLTDLQLMSSHSLEQLAILQTESDVLAAKGCGASGVDVLLLLVPATALHALVSRLKIKRWDILATSEDLYKNPLSS